MSPHQRNIWPIIVKIARRKQARGESFFTTAKKKENKIIRINPNNIIVQSEIDEEGNPGGHPRPVSRECLEEAWTILKALGQMNSDDMLSRVSKRNKYARTGAIIRGILFELPNVRKKIIDRKMTLIINRNRRSRT
ncbi:MAG: hypothetical protein RDU01_04100 [Thermodesulfovibrionales bacterium]|nr:hypothetical protein [Thermodesulfovibrionales bacterium]